MHYYGTVQRISLRPLLHYDPSKQDGAVRLSRGNTCPSSMRVADMQWAPDFVLVASSRYPWDSLKLTFLVPVEPQLNLFF